MRLSIEPIEERHRESLKQHLAPFGLPADIVEWKYFRRTLSQEGERGFVWVPHGQVRGAIGLIPFTVWAPGGLLRASWTCDWVVDAPESNPGIGVRLLHRAREAAGLLFTLGGNERNRQLMPRIAAASFADAAMEMHVPVRAGGSTWFRGVDRRLGGVLRPLRSMPMRTGRAGSVTIEAGVSSALEPLLVSPGASTCPAYDLSYLRWQIQECPVLQSVSCVSADRDAVSLCWARKGRTRDWRVALWSTGDRSSGTAQVLRSALRYVYGQSGQRVSVVVAKRDRPRVTLLESLGFLDSDQGKPLYVTTSRPESATALSTHSFLDSDLGYRF